MTKFWDFRLVKIVEFGFSQYILHILSCLFQCLFFIHTTLRIFRICKSLQSTYTCSHKIKLTYFTSRENLKTEPWKNMVVNTAVQNRSCVKYSIWMFAVFTLNTMGARQTNKRWMIMTTYEELLGICIKSKKTAYIQRLPNHLVKILQTNCFAIFGSSACQGSLCWQVQLLDPHTQMFKNSFEPYKQINKCQKK